MPTVRKASRALPSSCCNRSADEVRCVIDRATTHGERPPDLDPSLEVVSDWEDPYQVGVVYYLEAGRVRGVLLWNVWGKVDSARALITDPGPIQPDDLKGRISS